MGAVEGSNMLVVDNRKIAVGDAPHLLGCETALWESGYDLVAGVDEAGRGACAGPISVAACIMARDVDPRLEGLTDSKKLSPGRRQAMFDVIVDTAIAYSIVMIDSHEIDAKGIGWANSEGMYRAVANLDPQPSCVLIDAVKLDKLGLPHASLIKGDARVRCIAAASVLAKVARDDVMVAYDAAFPGYGFARHKGYGTAMHADAVRRHGGSPIHRYTYSNVAAAHGLYLEALARPNEGHAAGAGGRPHA